MNTITRNVLAAACIVVMAPSLCLAKKEHMHNPPAAGAAEDMRNWQDLMESLEALEASGGEDEQLKASLCGKAATMLDDLRNVVLERYPALKQRKVRADAMLRKIARQIRMVKQEDPRLTVGGRKSMPKRLKQLESDKERVLYKLELIEDELEALLHNDAALSKKFDKVHKILAEWCD